MFTWQNWEVSFPFLLHQHDTAMNNLVVSKQWRIFTIGSLIVLLVDFGGYLSTPAQIKIFENILCRRYYSSSDDESVCKAAPIQSELAFINGWKDTFAALPSIFVAVPFGVLADRIGRKPCVLIGFLGVVLGDTWTRVVC